ncbi:MULTISPECIES: CbiQ family ECF transporter T component [Streptomyces]|uniref:CbiQ family ECF transporter T component n=1 Tax=Streptomyces TaxID=1883 RepID=UPI001CCBE0E5|nr:MULTISPECIES: CbiQ family ECF transporter T component [Streptomyces]UBI35565.1 energy-coupling factor transporter transmembrane protein EcfT [Streptomyces mobaraensis]UKW28160.1 energy-coupling factor transporter transmembrane protein EcfT [Streptomyces sp. TYQ1024]
MSARPRGVLRAPLVLPRALHPGAWWLWALGLAAAAGRTSNPLLLALLVAAAGCVVVRRRGDNPWALAFPMYLTLGAFIVVSRVVFRVVFGGGQGEHVLFTLPEVPLPHWAAGIRLFGPVAAEQVLGGVYDGLRLAAMVVCVGAANALANPKRMLKALPGALYEIGTAVVVALTVAPQLVESVQRVRRARALRGGRQRGPRALRGIVIPVLEDALNRSLALAAAMASHGYGSTGRAGRSAPGPRRLSGALVVAGLLGVCAGLYGVLGSDTPRRLGVPLLLGGLAVAVLGFVVGGLRAGRSRYRPDRWRAAEFLVAGSGIATGALLYLASRADAADLYPPLSPLTWPEAGPLPVAAILVGALPAWLAPAAPGAVPGEPGPESGSVPSGGERTNGPDPSEDRAAGSGTAGGAAPGRGLSAGEPVRRDGSAAPDGSATAPGPREEPAERAAAGGGPSAREALA